MRGFRLLLIFVPPSLALNLEMEQIPEEFLEGRLMPSSYNLQLESRA